MKKNKQLSVQSWVWRSMIKTGIIPLILVEIVLVAIYMMSNHYISTDNMNYIRSHVDSELNISTTMESDIVRERILAISRLAKIYRSETERVLSEAESTNLFDTSNLVLSENGVLHSKLDQGGAASFYSAHTMEKKQLKPLIEKAKQKANSSR